jgi:condensin complex subunit 1
MRCGMMEVCGNLILEIAKQEEIGDTHKGQIEGFFDILEERLLDINPYCRSKSIQVFMKICELELQTNTLDSC